MKILSFVVLAAALFLLPGAASATGLVEENGGTTSGDLQLGSTSDGSAIDALGVSVADTGSEGDVQVTSSFFGGSFFNPFQGFDYFKKGCPPPIPEPTAAAVFGLGAVMVAAATRRRTRS